MGKSIIKNIFGVLIVFFYIFPVNVEFLPIGIRNIYVVVGFFFLIRNYGTKINEISLDKKAIRLLFICYILIIINLVSYVINGEGDFYFVTYPFTILKALIAAYTVIYSISSFDNRIFTIKYLLQLIIASCFFQGILSLSMYVYPQFQDFIYSRLAIDPLEKQAILGNPGRFIGIGANFFGAGIIMAYSFFYISILLRDEADSKKANKLILLMFFILIVGLNMARTTIIGLFMALLYSFHDFYKIGRDAWRRFLFVGAIISIIGYYVYTYYILEDEMLSWSFHRAFSLLYTYSDTGEIEDTESMIGESAWPLLDQWKTWIIGDAYMNDPKNPALGYYMHIDRGWNRIIYAVGLIGAFLYTIINYYICRLTGFSKRIWLIIFLSFVILMGKGMVNMALYMAPFIVHNALYNYKRTI